VLFHISGNPTNRELTAWPSSPFTGDKDLPTTSNARPRADRVRQQLPSMRQHAWNAPAAKVTSTYGPLQGQVSCAHLTGSRLFGRWRRVPYLHWRVFEDLSYQCSQRFFLWDPRLMSRRNGARRGFSYGIVVCCASRMILTAGSSLGDAPSEDS
jgi:hypothetical protein